MSQPVFHIATLGCKVNQYESQSVREAWRAAGAVETDDPAQATVILVNSCAITAAAVADVRQAVRRLHRAAPDAAILLSGCAAKLEETRLNDLPAIQAVVPQTEKSRLLRWFSPGQPEKSIAFPPFSIADFSRSRPIIKVQDGCSHRCTFCIVPSARGLPKSRPVDDVLEEVQRLLAAGFRELVLAGVNLAQYGPDLPGSPDFWDLINRLETAFAAQWAGRARFRLSSLEPGQLTGKALDTLARSRLLCPHLHLSLQSGSPAVLRRMARGHYDPAQLVPFFAELAKIWPLFGLGADLLVGFPAESEGDFKQTLALCNQLPMTYGHVFPYSPRPGTPAAAFANQVDKQTKTRRAAEIRALLQKKSAAFTRRLLQQKTLTIAPEDGRSQGPCEFYTTCQLTAPTPAKSLIPAAPTRIRQNRILAEPQ